MQPAFAATARVAAWALATVPATVIAVFIGLLWLIGLFSGDKGRKYVMGLTTPAMGMLRAFYCSAPTPPTLPG
jgi:hypothetical protein